MRYGAGNYDSGRRYDEPEALTRPKKMAFFALELRTLNDEQLRTLANQHSAAMDGNANFPDPDPTKVVFDAVKDEYSDLLDEIAQMEADLAAKRTEKDVKRKEVEAGMDKRASYAQRKVNGDKAKMQTTVLPLQADAVPTTSMPQPGNAVATTGDHEGEVDLGCNAVPRAKVYFWRRRTHGGGQPPGPWVDLPPSGRSSVTATGLDSGAEYAFSVRVLGPNDLMSPWSDECTARAK